MQSEKLTELERLRREKIAAQEQQAKPKSLDDIFDEDGNLDKTLVEDTKSRIPLPTGWRIALLPYRGVSKSKGGIALTRDTQEKNQLATNCGYVLKMGSLAYRDQDKFPEGPWCKEGDWVIFGRYAGARISIDGGEIRLLNDDEIIGVVNDPQDILHM